MAKSSDRALELVDLAGRLKLTPLQRNFVLGLVAAPRSSHTAAAIRAGASPKAAHIWASKTIRLGKVRQFLGEVREAAAARAREEALASPETGRVADVIMEAAEHQLRLSRLGRADIGRHLAIHEDGNVEVRIDPAYADIISELKVEERVDANGMRLRRTTIRIADPMSALQQLARLRGWDE